MRHYDWVNRKTSLEKIFEGTVSGENHKSKRSTNKRRITFQDQMGSDEPVSLNFKGSEKRTGKEQNRRK